MLYNTL